MQHVIFQIGSPRTLQFSIVWQDFGIAVLVGVQIHDWYIFAPKTSARDGWSELNPWFLVTAYKGRHLAFCLYHIVTSIQHVGLK